MVILNPPLHSHHTYVGKGYNIMLFIVLEKMTVKKKYFPNYTEHLVTDL